MEVYSLTDKYLSVDAHPVAKQGDEVVQKANWKRNETVAEGNLLVQEPSSPSDLLSLEQRSLHCANLAGPEKDDSPC